MVQKHFNCVVIIWGQSHNQKQRVKWFGIHVKIIPNHLGNLLCGCLIFFLILTAASPGGSGVFNVSCLCYLMAGVSSVRPNKNIPRQQMCSHLHKGCFFHEQMCELGTPYSSLKCWGHMNSGDRYYRNCISKKKKKKGSFNKNQCMWVNVCMLQLFTERSICKHFPCDATCTEKYRNKSFSFFTTRVVGRSNAASKRWGPTELCFRGPPFISFSLSQHCKVRYRLRGRGLYSFKGVGNSNLMYLIDVVNLQHDKSW